MKLKLAVHDVTWRFWVISWGLIISGLMGWERGFLLVTGLAAFQIIYLAVLEKSLTSLSVQVRIAFFLLVLAGLKFPFIYWWPAFGLFVRITIDYCLLARILSLMPWNLKEPFGMALVKRRIFSPPTSGSVLNS